MWFFPQSHKATTIGTVVTLTGYIVNVRHKARFILPMWNTNRKMVLLDSSDAGNARRCVLCNVPNWRTQRRPHETQ
jgi:hypothetical protein